MKYILLCIILILLCIFAGIKITHSGGNRAERGPGQTVMMTVIFIVLLITAISLWFLSDYYRAGDDAFDYLMSDRYVTVQKSGNVYRFDGPGESSAVIFYPGALVSEKAYAPLMYKIAERGTDCFLIKMPFHMAPLNKNGASDVLEKYDYDKWYLAGHSLGGAIASSYYSENPDAADGIILLAAYPTDELPEQARLLSIYGSKDGCLDRKQYNKNRQNWPSDSTEKVIYGGNHSGFADYGPQKGDGAATITAEEQQERTADAVSNICNGDQ